MIKINVITKNVNWFKFIKNPTNYVDRKIKKLNLKIKNYKKKVPLGRLAKSREIAACCLFLSSEASTYVTGTTMVVDGGWTSI